MYRLILLFILSTLSCGATTTSVVSSSGTVSGGRVISGIQTFLGLTDTPNSYSGSNGYFLRVQGNKVAFTSNAGLAGLLDHGALSGLADDDHTQYHNNSRALTWLGTRSTSDLPEGSNQYFTNERVDDRVNGLVLTGSSKLTKLYNDAGNSLTLDVSESNLTLSNLGGSVTDGQVPNSITLDNITQITTRSHTSLSDIGTNTHAQLDSHLTNGNIHFRQSAIDHGSIAGLADDDHTQYHNDSRADTWLGTKTTTNLAEGTNLYYTGARVNGDIAQAGLVPYTGAISDVDIGTYDLITDAIKADGSGGVEVQTNTGNKVLLVGAGGSTAATAYGTWNFNGATASTIASFGASKGLESLSTSTYPSLTELSYVKGVTSAIQTQINTKQASDNDLTALAALSGTGIAVRTASDTWTTRNIAFDNGITLTNNGGVSGNPRITQDLNLSTYTNDAGFLTGNQTITLTGAVTGSGATSISTTLANNIVTSAKISNGTIIGADLANADFGDFTVSSGTATIDNSAITSGKILNGTILTADIDNGTHGYYLKSVNGAVTWAVVAGGGADAATLDGLDSTQFLRSDTSDSYTSGTLTLDAGTTFDVNSTSVSIADTNITLDGATTTFTQTGATGTITMTPKANANFVVQQSQNGQVLFDNSSGSVVAILDSTSSYGDPSVTSIFGDAAIKFKENGTTQWAIGFKANGDTFRIDDSGLFANNRFVIKNDGNVGIGTATPAHKLSVAGTINATGNITGANLSGTNTGDQTITLTSDVTGSGTSSIATTIASNAVTSAKILNGTIATADIASSITLTTPNIGAATGTSLTTTGKIVAGTNINGTTANLTKVLSSGVVNGVSLNISNGAAFLAVKNIGNGGTTEAFDFTKANKFIMALNASTCAISAGTDPRGATSLQLMIQQRAGSQTVTWTACGSASGFCWPGGTAPTLTTSANAIDIISCLYNPTKDRYYCNSSLDLR